MAETWFQFASRIEGEDDANYIDRMRRVTPPRGLSDFWGEVLLPRIVAWRPGPLNAATANKRQPDDLTAEERGKFIKLQAALRDAQAQYDQLATTYGGPYYWRILKEDGEDAAKAWLKRDLARQGLRDEEITAEVQRRKADYAKGETAGLTVAGTALTAIAWIPVVGQILAAIGALTIAVYKLVRSLAPTERPSEDYRRWEEGVKQIRQQYLTTRQEGLDTFRGFCTDAMVPQSYTGAGGYSEDDLLEAQQLVNRRLFSLSMLTGVDWMALFPVLPFGTVIQIPFLLDGLPEVSEAQVTRLFEQAQQPTIKDWKPLPLDYRLNPFSKRL